MATAPANPDATGFITINSQDRYPTYEIARNPARAISSNDITYTLPGFSKFKKIQLDYAYMRSSGLNFLNIPASNTNVINASLNGGADVLITLPLDWCLNMQNILGSTPYIFQSLLRQKLNDQTILFNLQLSSNSSGVPTGGMPAYQNSSGSQGSAFRLLNWKSSTNTLSFSRVQNYNGVNISNKKQLFDLFGMAYTITDGVPRSATSQINQWAGTIYAYQSNPAYTNFIDLVSPDLSSDDVSSTPNATNYGSLVARFFCNSGVSGSQNEVQTFNAQFSYLKSMTPLNGDTIRIRMLNDQGELIPPFTIPTVQINTLTGGTFTGSGTVGTITFTSSPISAGFSAGQQVTVAGIASGAGQPNLLVTLSTVTATTVTFPTQLTTTTASMTMTGPYNPNGTTTPGSFPEYNLMFVGIPHTDLMATLE